MHFSVFLVLRICTSFMVKLPWFHYSAWYACTYIKAPPAVSDCVGGFLLLGTSLFVTNFFAAGWHFGATVPVTG